MRAGRRGDVSTTSHKQGMATASWVGSPRAFIAPLALAQFICSFAGSNMNVMINDISRDLNTDVKGVQTCITLFLLIMAVLMIPCSKLTDRWGRKRCFTGGLVLYGIGALLSAIAPGLPDPARLHPDDDGVHLDRVPREGVRGDQRVGGHRRRGGTSHRWSHHLRDQLASGVRVPSPRGCDDRLPEPTSRRSGKSGF